MRGEEGSVERRIEGVDGEGKSGVRVWNIVGCNGRVKRSERKGYEVWSWKGSLGGRVSRGLECVGKLG